MYFFQYGENIEADVALPSKACLAFRSRESWDQAQQVDI